MSSLLQLTAIGPIGRTGANVLSLVEEEYRIAQEVAPTPHRNLEEKNVLGRATKREHAIKSPVQVMS